MQWHLQRICNGKCNVAKYMNTPRYICNPKIGATGLQRAKVKVSRCIAFRASI